ncbi:BT4734/BF3469 family protein [Vibrio rarus]|uniref:BT4734/BF3469 family protein n=1 Tax=Vibrio rarus TaxID=413403 RepID=UPI0021C3687F|nr:BT4734/BF3469 family protein [Vibrio rarus]
MQQNYKITLYENPFDTTPIRVITLHELVNTLKHDLELKRRIDAYREAPASVPGFRINPKKDLKSNLPAFSVGEFTQRRNDCLVGDAGAVMIFDYDGIKDVANSRKLLHTASNLIESLTLGFVSPSGGLKLICKTSLRTRCNDTYNECYALLREHIEEQLDIELDSCTCDISRMCYLSFDDELYFNSAADEYVFDDEFITRLKYKRMAQIQLYAKAWEKHETEVIDANKQLRLIEKAIKHYREYNSDGNRHKMLYTLAQHLLSYMVTRNQLITIIKSLKFTEKVSIESFVDDQIKTFRATGKPFDGIYEQVLI